MCDGAKLPTAENTGLTPPGNCATASLDQVLKDASDLDGILGSLMDDPLQLETSDGHGVRREQMATPPPSPQPPQPPQPPPLQQLCARQGAPSAPPPAPSPASPLLKHKSGTWSGSLACVDDVACLSQHLQDKWTNRSCYVGKGVLDLWYYDSYDMVSDPEGYDQEVQQQSTLRVGGTCAPWLALRLPHLPPSVILNSAAADSGPSLPQPPLCFPNPLPPPLRVGGPKNATRVASIIRVMPGLAGVEAEATKLAQSVAKEQFGEEVKLWNFHLLKQARHLDRGSGFGVHIDERDDGKGKFRAHLLLSLAVKLTSDPDGSEGSWMQVVGHGPVQYGASAASFVLFESSRPHLSLLTPVSVGTVLKIVFFYTRSEEAI